MYWQVCEVSTVAVVDQGIGDEEFFVRKNADFAGILLPESQKQLSAPFAAFFAGINDQNWFFLNHLTAHAQIFINNPFHRIDHHVVFGGELLN
jgi:hypothetical protein